MRIIIFVFSLSTRILVGLFSYVGCLLERFGFIIVGNLVKVKGNCQLLREYGSDNSWVYFLKINHIPTIVEI